MLVTMSSQRLYNPYEVMMVVRRMSECDLVSNLDEKKVSDEQDFFLRSSNQSGLRADRMF